MTKEEGGTEICREKHEGGGRERTTREEGGIEICREKHEGGGRKRDLYRKLLNRVLKPLVVS